MNKKLYRSKRNKVVGGVCAGVADYFSTDPSIIRLVWAAAIFLGGTGIMAYIVAYIIMPEGEPDGYNGYGPTNSSVGNINDEINSFRTPNEFGNTPDREFDDRPFHKEESSNKNLFGIILISIGAFFLLRETFNIDSKYFVPIIFIAIGAGIVFKGRRKW